MIYFTTPTQQLWKHKSGQVVRLEAIAPKGKATEFTYENMGSESELISIGWAKVESSEYLGRQNHKMPITQAELNDVDNGWDL